MKKKKQKLCGVRPLFFRKQQIISAVDVHMHPIGAIEPQDFHEVWLN